MKKVLAVTGLALLVASQVQAAEFKPAVVYGLGGKFDKSFNESVVNGVARFTKDTGIKVFEFEPTNTPQIEQGLSKMAKRKMNPIIAVGFDEANALEKVAKENPESKFAIIDSVVDQPNVESIVFKEQEGSFLVGALAAMASKSGKVGFVGGMDIGLIRRFECGYEQGAKYINKDITVYQNMTGSTPEAWNNPGKGGELAKSQFDRGADVVFAAAGGTGLGVYQAAADAHKYAIGVDSNQNYLHPGVMLTSMVKSVDVAAYSTFKEVQDGTWKPGVKALGLAENGVSWAYDQYNKDLITAEMKAKMKEIQADIVSGKIQVHDYMADNACTY
ncbi:BMP family ABC transporter substrate-binding protein [Pokkaliibacter sp. MBI-7]|uniref:BMP family lipoprotein n=1 Tax=Pokkaliibacter sp. MBI-7 TaxID=3040600 RepID=UPI0024494A39|nr:BMP family ABC transporter substrate-binding protein [Pokkaliibacter sp. MBI-7]MDH2436317.1 BMP family ABC transporter substrate-binding protein [Pokkaliibacter sp. MBI-7]